VALKEDMKRIVHEVVRDLALPYRVQHVFELQHPAGIWGSSFFDPTAHAGRHVFQIGIGPVDESTPDCTKAELARRLLERESG
jgi:hypothetical protein